MLSVEIIKNCVDLAREMSEKLGPKEAKYYENGILSNFFGIFIYPRYPSAKTVTCLEDLWRSFEPRLASNDQKAELLLSWIYLVNRDSKISKNDILSRLTSIVERHQAEYNDGLAKGINYSFIDPFLSLVREVDKAFSGINDGLPKNTSSLFFKDSYSALEYAVKFCDTSPNDGAELIAIVDSIKDLGMLSILDVRVALDGSLVQKFFTVESHLKISIGDLISTVYFMTNEVETFEVISILEPCYEFGFGWKINRSIH